MKRPQCKDHHLINDDLVIYCKECGIFLKKGHLISKSIRDREEFLVGCPYCYAYIVYKIKDNHQYDLLYEPYLWTTETLEEAHHCSMCNELGTEFLEIPIIGKLCKSCYGKYREN